MGPKVSPDDIEAQRPFVSKVCTGDAGCLVNALCCPFVMGFQSVNIYCLPAMWLYFLALLDGVFCSAFRLICCACCFRYTDKKFKANASSIGAWKGKTAAEVDKEVTWERASLFFAARLTDEEKKRGVRVKLFEGKISPKDVGQGQVGNCWLIAAFACISEHPGLLMKAFITKRATSLGKYKVRLFDATESKWVTLTVDENIPIKGGQPLMAQPKGRELWVAMLVRPPTSNHFFSSQPQSDARCPLDPAPSPMADAFWGGRRRRSQSSAGAIPTSMGGSRRGLSGH
jgi:hypothetical protein